MPAFWGYPLPPHDYPYYWVILDPKSEDNKVKVTNLKNSPKFQFLKFWSKHYMWHTLWSCLIRYANMKWIRWVLLKIQSGHYSVHRRTEGQTDKVKQVYLPFNFVEVEGIKRHPLYQPFCPGGNKFAITRWFPMGGTFYDLRLRNLIMCFRDPRIVKYSPVCPCQLIVISTNKWRHKHVNSSIRSKPPKLPDDS